MPAANRFSTSVAARTAPPPFALAGSDATYSSKRYRVTPAASAYAVGFAVVALPTKHE